jgi:hypothetical protein
MGDDRGDPEPDQAPHLPEGHVPPASVRAEGKVLESVQELDGLHGEDREIEDRRQDQGDDHPPGPATAGNEPDLARMT